MYFYIQACKNGHFQADYKRLKEGQVCETCGEPLMETCPSCGELIQRWTYYGSVPTCYKASSYVLPDTCPKCGNDYPWAGANADAKAQNAKNLIADMKHANEEASIIKKPLNMTTGKEVSKCKYAFFPGCQLGASEPEIVVKAYDSILFQHPDTAMFLQCCGIPAQKSGDNAACDKVLADIRSNWESLGKPEMIMACMGCYNLFKEKLPEIPVISLYEMLQKMAVSGGCNSVDYTFIHPDPENINEKTAKAVEEIADGMGAKLHTADEDVDYPYLTYSIMQRDMLKKEGKDAAHILELVFGMGASNTHLIHEHDHDHDDGHGYDAPAPAIPFAEPECDGNCATCSSVCGAKPSPPAPLPTEEERRANRIELKNVLLQLFWNEF